MKLAECLLRRKELQQKIDRIRPLREMGADLFKVKVERVAVGAGTDIEELKASIPRISFAELDGEYNLYAKQLRLVDAAIQQTNWTADVDGVDSCFVDYVHKED